MQSVRRGLICLCVLHPNTCGGTEETSGICGMNVYVNGHIHSFVPEGLKSTYYVPGTVIVQRRAHSLRAEGLLEKEALGEGKVRKRAPKWAQVRERTLVPRAALQNALHSCPGASQPSMISLHLQSPEG